MKDEKHLLADIEELKKSPWFNASYISDERRLGIREALDMISSIIRNRGGEMNGEKVAKQLEKDVAAYRAGFADGYRAAKAELTTCQDCRHWLSVPWLPEGRKVCGLTNDVKRACGFCDFAERREEE